MLAPAALAIGILLPVRVFVVISSGVTENENAFHLDSKLLAISTFWASNIRQAIFVRPQVREFLWQLPRSQPACLSRE